MKKTPFNMIVFSSTLGCMLAFALFGVNFSSIFFVLIGGSLGLAVYLTGLLLKKEKGDK